MAAKRPSLAESMKAVGQDQPAAQVIAAPETPPAASSKGEGRGYHAATREGKKKVTALLSPEDHRRIKRLSVDQGRKMEDLTFEAVTDLLAKYNV